MRTKSIQQLSDQWGRINSYLMKKGWFEKFIVSYCNYKSNMAHHLDHDPIWPTSRYDEKKYNTQVPFEIYTK